jgi:hypothetical protein
VTKILTDPKGEWAVIEAEPTTADKLYKGYIVPLAAIPAIAQFIGHSFIGTTTPFLGTIRMPIVSGLIWMCVSYVLTLAMVYVAALIVNKLAPTFNSTSNDTQALKLVAYSETPVWIAGVLGIVPALGVIGGLVGGLYAIYIFYLGLPVMMKTPQDKVIPYMVVSAIVVIVLAVIAGTIAGLFIGAAALTL